MQNISNTSSNDDSSENVHAFLDFLDHDIQNNPQNLQTLDGDLISYVQSLFVGEEIDIDAPIDQPSPKFGSAKGLVKMSDDFDEPLDDFEEYAPSS